MADMDLSSLTSAPALSQYAAALLAKQKEKAAGDAAQPQDTDALTARLTTAPTDFRTKTAQHHLDTQQAALGKELAAGLAKAGVKLSGHVSFSVGAKGQLAVDGSDADTAAVEKWMKSDTSKPSLQSRMADLLTSAQKLSSQTQQNNAISLAARYAGAPGNVMAMYSQFMGHTDSTPAVLSFDGTASALSYPGALSSHA
jgi:hypothetical protein